MDYMRKYRLSATHNFAMLQANNGYYSETAAMRMEEDMTTMTMNNAYDCSELAPTRRTNRPFQAVGLLRTLARAPIAFIELLLLWQGRAEQRGRLRQFDDRMLRDIGLSRADVEMEANKPFWRA